MAELLGYIIGGLVLLGVGAAAGYWYALNGRERSKSEAIQAEFDAYRNQVGTHFEQTAQHFQTIGREYRALYDHMASGAEQLCEPQSADQRLSFDPTPGPTPSAEAPVDTEAEALEEQQSAVSAAPEPTPEPVESGFSDTDTDGSTPESRAREAGGESAPAEEQDIAEADSEAAAESGDDPIRLEAEAEEAAGAEDEPAPSTPDAQQADGSAENNERTYH